MHPDQIIELFTAHGQLAYEGEGVTQLQHAWQTGRLAQLAGASPALQLAAWLHDIGHLMTDLTGSPTTRGVDDAHERRAASALSAAFGPEVAAPVALHVLAKRWLVARRPGYGSRLSPDSVRSLALQGGPMRADEAAAYLALPHARAALRLRIWDDQAKQADLQSSSNGQALDDLHALMRTVSA